jgi:hypothetical protein
MEIRIDAAPNGYKLVLEKDDGACNVYPGEIHDLTEALKFAGILAAEVERETGNRPEPIISYRALRENKNRDVHARKAWDRLVR